MEECSAGVPFKGPLQPAALAPVIFFRAIQLDDLFLQEIAEGPTLLVETRRVSELVKLLNLGEEVIPSLPPQFAKIGPPTPQMLAKASRDALPEINAASVGSQLSDTKGQLILDHLFKTGYPKPPRLEEKPRGPANPLFAVIQE
jgi:hypothetical protein